MKKLIAASFIVALVSCNTNKTKDFVTFSGKITNNKADTIRVVNRDYSKAIAVNEDGTFSDTLHITPGIFYFDNGTESTPLFLKNGYDIFMSLNTEAFDETITYSGKGAENNNYLAKKSLFQEKLFDQDFNDLGLEELDVKIEEMTNKLNEFVEQNKNLDSLLLDQERKEIPLMMNSYKQYYSEVISLKQAMPAGAPSPTFKNFENIDGTTTSLSDLKGKNVYIDVWATWCAPCKAEIPYLKQLEKDYEGKDIVFVSLSIDDDRSHGGSWEKAKESWKNMVQEKNLGGIQIFAPQGWQTPFVQEYRVNGIPRFIMIDKEGNIVDPSAPRPSDEAVRTLIDGLVM